MDQKTFNTSKDCTYSVNKKNVFRGLHINTFGKLITCITGHFIDIIVNMKSFEVKYFDIKPGDQIYCPPHYAHGFISLEENSVLSYHCEGYFGNEIGGLLNYKDPYLNIKLPISDDELILNEKDLNAPYLQFDYFIMGHNGFIGSNIYQELLKQNKKVLIVKHRMEEINKVENLILFYKPKYFINCAGLTGVPNTKWCNTNKKETLMTNVINQINILNLCYKHSVHCTLIGSGAIFKTENHNEDKLQNKLSDDKGNLIDNDNYYSYCRILLEEQIQVYNNFLLLRINYPLSFNSINLNNPKNLIYKLNNYDQIENISLSVTNLDSLCPIIPLMIENNETGIFNFVNEGQINLLDLVKIINKDKIFDIINTTRESINLIPDKLKKYNIENIYSSIKF
jgi:dTDP-4-dehydrorhamnose 3,5-epimerase-like enzyme/nucleoside-diphosphate-sugar epimerase